MKILVVGGGGREHALVWKLKQSPQVEQVYCVPGNAGIAREAGIEQADTGDPRAVADLAERLGVELTVIGPEAPLVAGVADEFSARGLPLLGPAQTAASLEGSKVFAKYFMHRHHVPTADFAVCTDLDKAEQQLDRFGYPVVLKADGLAAGKGVVVAKDRTEAWTTLGRMLSGEFVGEAGRRVVIERFLPGEEISFIVLTDGRTVVPFAPTQDHKAVFDNDEGPNTGGMGAYCDDAIVSDELRRRIMDEVVGPTIRGIGFDGTKYRGFLYFGLMITDGRPRVLEYNVRLGDPETQPLMMRLKSDLAPVLKAAAAGDLEGHELAWSEGATVCVVLASGGYPGAFERGKHITGLAQAGSMAGVKVFHAGTTVAGGEVVTAGGRVLGVTAQGADLREAIGRAYEAAERIRFDGMHYRRDIGRKGLRRNEEL